ncbi:GH3 auxin-responsive promoter family protein [Algivirga pacifica]|uniref:GH3 auxin-responsive promoter family protein n=1 Tax=Algivirga pacifica TaxID=1162670 RepID=A0ABP9CY93_9BACT
MLTKLLFHYGLSLKGKLALKRFLRNTDTPQQVQHKLLESILKTNANTHYGKQYSFDEIQNVHDYQQQVPVVEYQDIEPYVQKSAQGVADQLFTGVPMYFATTSGSTGTPKFIPISKRSHKETHTKIVTLTAYLALKNCPSAFNGKIMGIGAPAIEGYTEGGISYGSASGQIEKGANSIIKKKYALPPAIAEIKDYTAKYYALLRLSMEQDVSIIITANPSTLIALARYMNQWKDMLLENVRTGTYEKSFDFGEEAPAYFRSLKANPKKAQQIEELMGNSSQLLPVHLWPNLKLLTCWMGGNCKNYLDSVKKLYGNVDIKDPGFMASEMRSAIPLRLNDSSGVLAIHDNFYEFVAVEEIEQVDRRFLTLAEVEVGKQYYIFITNHSGLYRYNMNDIIAVTGYHQKTPEIVFIQKGKGITSITGEKLFEQQVIMAMDRLKEEEGLGVPFYMVLANKQTEGYELYLEGDKALSSEDLKHIGAQYDTYLKELNIEYKTKRDSSRLIPLKVTQVAEHSYEHYRQWRLSQGVRGAQFKMNYLVDETAHVEALQHYREGVQQS